MRRILAMLVLASPAAQDAAGSRAALANDWLRVEFRQELRVRALEFMAAAGPARARIREQLGVDVGPGATIVVTADAAEMGAEVRRLSGREPPDWAGGLALSAQRVVVVRCDLPGERFDRVDSIVTHELVHLAVARSAAEAGGARVPRWFEEGLAQWVAGRARPLEVPDLRPAATFGSLLDLDEMNAAFARGEGAAARAYAQAESFVRFLARRAGRDALRRILELAADGVELDAAVLLATSADLPTSWALWKRELASDRSWLLSAGFQAIVAALILVAVALGVRRVLQRRRTIEATWEPEPEASSRDPGAG